MTFKLAAAIDVVERIEGSCGFPIAGVSVRDLRVSLNSCQGILTAATMQVRGTIRGWF